MILLSLVETCLQLHVSVQAGGAERQVCFLLCCRDCPGLGSYDKVVSIEMIEAVGHEHLNSYFGVINAALKPGGKAVIQVGGGLTAAAALVGFGTAVTGAMVPWSWLTVTAAIM